MKWAASLAIQHGSTDEDFHKFILCKEFGWLPSEVEQEDWLILEKFMHYIKYTNDFQRSKAPKKRN